MAAPQRTNTLFPGNAVSSLGKRRAETDIESSRLSASKIPSVPKFLGSGRVTPPPALPIKPNHRSRQYSPTPRFGPATKQRSISQGLISQGSPWQAHGFMPVLREKRQGGILIAHKQVPNHPLVTVKQHECVDSEVVNKFVRPNHANIVYLHEIYVDDHTLYFMYERADVSLSEMQATPYGEFASYQIAAICQEILNGIRYIHDELNIVHGSIVAENVLVSIDGSVKLANIGQSMLESITRSENEHRDYRSLGCLMVRLMERSTNLADPDAVQLQHPEAWEAPIKEFLGKTFKGTGKILQEESHQEATA